MKQEGSGSGILFCMYLYKLTAHTVNTGGTAPTPAPEGTCKVPDGPVQDSNATGIPADASGLLFSGRGLFPVRSGVFMNHINRLTAGTDRQQELWQKLHT